MKILVTGATGFLGTHLCGQLTAQDHEITKINSKNADLTQEKSLLTLGQTAIAQLLSIIINTLNKDLKERSLFIPIE